MRQFQKFFTDNFIYNSNIRGHLKLADKPAGFKFETSLNQDQMLYFLFQKKHQSKTDEAFSINTELSVIPKENLTLMSKTYVNVFFQSRGKLDGIGLQNKLEIYPQEGLNHRLVFEPKFSQTLLCKYLQKFYYGGKISYLNQRSFSLVGFYKDSRFNSHVEIKPIEKQIVHGLAYLTKINEVFGYQISYDHN